MELSFKVLLAEKAVLVVVEETSELPLGPRAWPVKK